MRLRELILVITAREWRHVAQGNMACQKGMFPVFPPDAILCFLCYFLQWSLTTLFKIGTYAYINTMEIFICV